MSPAEKKVWEYLVTHKTPVAAGTLAKRFIMSQSRISAILKILYEQGLTDIVTIGRHKFHKIKNIGGSA